MDTSLPTADNEEIAQTKTGGFGPQKIAKIALALALLVAAVCLIRAVWDSMNWRYVHDSSLMIYAGYLVSEGFVPYRDFFDMNVPGVYFLMWLVGSLFGWGDSSFRVFDLLCLAAISGMTFFWLRRFGYLAAFTAGVAFPLWYIAYGSGMSLQREYMALVPFAALLLVGTVRLGLSSLIRLIVSGVLTAVAVLIKPQMLLLALPVLAFLVVESEQSGKRRRLYINLAAGVALPLLITFIYLMLTGSLGPFFDIAFNYWPLYTHMTRWHETVGGWDRLVYIVQSTISGLTTFYLPAAVVGLIVVGRDDNHRRFSLMLAGIVLGAAIYPAFSGQFFGYHWIPFSYVAICAASLALSNLKLETWSLKGLVPVVLVLFMLLTLSSTTYDRIRNSWQGYGGGEVVTFGAPDAINEFLRDNLKPGDVVQPLDWTSGAVHGMLMARAMPATRFIYDFHFYHHVSDPYIKELRREFMNGLFAAKPRFMIQVLDKRPWPRGEDTTRDFPELMIFLQQNYRIALRGRIFVIFERVDAAPGG